MMQNRSILSPVFATLSAVVIAGVAVLLLPTHVVQAKAPNFKSLGFQSQSEMNNYLTIGSTEVVEIDANGKALAVNPVAHLRGAGDIEPGDITPWITLGEKIWAMIAANKPVANVETMRAFVLPQNKPDWTQMESWQGPAHHSYRIEYTNLYGIKVVSHDYMLAFNYGGSSGGVGQFLANVTLIPSEVSVAWGYTLNATVEVGTAVNTGTKDKPVPGLDLTLVTKIDTILNHVETHDMFFVKGDGQSQYVNDPDQHLTSN